MHFLTAIVGGKKKRNNHKCLVFNLKVKRVREWKELYKNLLYPRYLIAT